MRRHPLAVVGSWVRSPCTRPRDTRPRSPAARPRRGRSRSRRGGYRPGVLVDRPEPKLDVHLLVRREIERRGIEPCKGVVWIRPRRLHAGRAAARHVQRAAAGASAIGRHGGDRVDPPAEVIRSPSAETCLERLTRDDRPTRRGPEGVDSDRGRRGCRRERKRPDGRLAIGIDRRRRRCLDRNDDEVRLGVRHPGEPREEAANGEGACVAGAVDADDERPAAQLTPIEEALCLRVGGERAAGPLDRRVGLKGDDHLVARGPQHLAELEDRLCHRACRLGAPEHTVRAERRRRHLAFAGQFEDSPRAPRGTARHGPLAPARECAKTL